MNFLPVSPSQIQDTMARLRYFEGWDKALLARLAVGAKQMPLARRDRLLAKGAGLASLYVVVSGQLKLFIPLPNGAERVVALVERGETFGEACLLRNETCPYEVIAGKDSYLIAIDALVYRRELRDNPAMIEQTLAVVAQRFLNTLRDIEICAQPSSLQRVAQYLVHLRPGEEAAADIRLPALKRDIAGKLGVTQETFSRMLAFMAKQGFIQLKGSLIRVEDWARLHRFIQAGCPMEALGEI